MSDSRRGASPGRSILAMISSRGGGDWPPVVALAQGLRDRGHQVRVLCDSGSAAAVRAADLPTICVPAELEQGPYFQRWTQQFVERGARPPPTYPLVDWGNDCQASVRASIESAAPEMVVSSLFCMGLATVVASELAIPWCFVNPSFYFGEGSRRPWGEDFSELGVTVFRDVFLPLAKKATLVLHATDGEFDPRPDPMAANHHYVGPLLWEPSTDEPPYLSEAGDPWALVTVSTIPQEGELVIARAAMRALEYERVRVVVTMPGGQARAEVGPIPENARVVDYVSHSAVLRRSRLVISHAGHGIVMKGLYYGVPMVLVPWGRDQPGVAQRAEAAGVAAVVPRDECNQDRVGAAIRRVLDDPDYRAKAQRISARLQAENAVEISCDHVDRLLEASIKRTGTI